MNWEVIRIKKALIAYFSASGVTEKLAKTLAATVNGDLFEIRPPQPYTDADLNWNDSHSRSTVEMQDKSARPELVGEVADMAQYDTVFVGFPIWWYEAPRIIQTFLEHYDLTGKTVVPFGTSGGSAMGKTASILQKSCPGAKVLEGRVLRSSAPEKELSGWVAGMAL